MKLLLLNIMIALSLCPAPVAPDVNTEGLCTVEIVEPTPEPETVKMEALATAYCGCVQCCGKSDCITATGTRATEGRTIAADPRVIPYGTHVLINGHEYIVEDCGGAINGNRIDIYFESHADALQFGVQTVTVEILQKEASK